MKKCQCERCAPRTIKPCSRVYAKDMNSHQLIRYQSPSFWCQCGAWKYDDAPCCSDCWDEQGSYNENR